MGHERRTDADHTQRHDDDVAPQPVGDQHVEYPSGGLQRLVLLAVGQRERRDPLAAEPAHQPVEVQQPHRLVGHDEHVARRHAPGDQVRIVEQAGADQDRIAAAAQIDDEPLHQVPLAASSRRMISSTTVATLRPSVSTARSAVSS